MEEKKSTEISCGIALCKKSRKLYVFEGQTWFGLLLFAWWLLLVVFVSPHFKPLVFARARDSSGCMNCVTEAPHQLWEAEFCLKLKTAGFMDEMNGISEKKPGSFWHWNHSIFINF